MFDFYFAGSQCKEADKVIVQLNGNRLFSFIQDKKNIYDYIEHKNNGWKGKLLIDSGAFTAHRKDIDIDIDVYCDWINHNEDNIFKAINLDHIPGKFGVTRTAKDILYAQKKSYGNYCYMVDKVNNGHKILPVFHQNENMEYLDKYLNFKINGKYIDYICLSGMKDLTRQQRQSWYKEVYEHIKKSKNPNIKTHILGSATLSDVEKFPVTSMDATSWIMTSANGSIMTDYGIVYVSEKCEQHPNHINNMCEEAKKNLITYLKSINMTLDEVCSNYKNRTVANVIYLYNKSVITEFKGLNTNKRRLF